VAMEREGLTHDGDTSRIELWFVPISQR
jgi:hypothetical protein